MTRGNGSDHAEYLDPIFDQVGETLVSSSAVEVALAAVSHRGKVRPTNEDHYLVVRADRALSTLMTNVPSEMVPGRFGETAYGLLVADGMGGMSGGDVASSLAISALIHLALATPDWIMRFDERQTKRWMERMTERFRLINIAVLERARRDPSLSGMGTTMTLAIILGSNLFIAHLGDSRAYVMREGKLRQMTRDHTLSHRLVEAGLITPEEAVSHGARHVLTNVIGGAGRIEADIQQFKLEDGDSVLLCTDGLTEMVSDAAIAEILKGIAPPAEACQGLVDLALERGGEDNVTVLLARYRTPKAA